VPGVGEKVKRDHWAAIVKRWADNTRVEEETTTMPGKSNRTRQALWEASTPPAKPAPKRYVHSRAKLVGKVGSLIDEIDTLDLEDVTPKRMSGLLTEWSDLLGVILDDLVEEKE
jgi:hypothetical protein